MARAVSGTAVASAASSLTPQRRGLDVRTLAGGGQPRQPAALSKAVLMEVDGAAPDERLDHGAGHWGAERIVHVEAIAELAKGLAEPAMAVGRGAFGNAGEDDLPARILVEMALGAAEAHHHRAEAGSAIERGKHLLGGGGGAAVGDIEIVVQIAAGGAQPGLAAEE